MSNYPNVPATDYIAITKSDDTDLTASAFRALYVGGAGDVVLRAVGSSTSVTFASVQAGTVLPVTCSRVMAATTATSIVGLV